MVDGGGGIYTYGEKLVRVAAPAAEGGMGRRPVRRRQAGGARQSQAREDSRCGPYGCC